MSENKVKNGEKTGRLLNLPEPQRTVYEAAINTLIEHHGEGAILLKKLKTAEGFTFSIQMAKLD